MTREEALQILDTIPTIGEQVDALEMAIQALSQEPCDDAVNRQAVREILSNARLGESKLAYELDKLPSVQRTSNADKKHVENTLDDLVSRKDVRKVISILYGRELCEILYQINLLPSVQEIQFARQNPMMTIDTRFCSLGGCDGSMFIDRHRKAESKE